MPVDVSIYTAAGAARLTIDRSGPYFFLVITTRRTFPPRLPRLLHLMIIQPRLPISDLSRLLFGALVIRITVRQGGIVDVIPIPLALLRLVLFLLPPSSALVFGLVVPIVIVVIVADPVLEVTLLDAGLLLQAARRTRLLL